MEWVTLHVGPISTLAKSFFLVWLIADIWRVSLEFGLHAIDLTNYQSEQ